VAVALRPKIQAVLGSLTRALNILLGSPCTKPSTRSTHHLQESIDLCHSFLHASVDRRMTKNKVVATAVLDSVALLLNADTDAAALLPVLLCDELRAHAVALDAFRLTDRDQQHMVAAQKRRKPQSGTAPPTVPSDGPAAAARLWDRLRHVDGRRRAPHTKARTSKAAAYWQSRCTMVSGAAAGPAAAAGPGKLVHSHSVVSTTSDEGGVSDESALSETDTAAATLRTARINALFGRDPHMWQAMGVPQALLDAEFPGGDTAPVVVFPGVGSAGAPSLAPHAFFGGTPMRPLSSPPAGAVPVVLVAAAAPTTTDVDDSPWILPARSAKVC
jgi:hypothetical protein